MSDVLTIVGARPQFIKASPVSRAFASLGITEEIVHTGQHYDENMSAVFFRELGIPEPAHNLGIGSGSHGVQTGRMIEAIEALLIDRRPRLVLIYGDTNSTLAGAVATVKLHIKLGHVEAGLRSFNKRMPEEVNRILADHVSDLLFAPSEVARNRLLEEGIVPDSVFLTGDVMYDAALYFSERAQQCSSILEDTGLTPGRYILATIHRAENTDDRPRLMAILEALKSLAEDIEVVLPLHPRTRKMLPAGFSGLTVIDPVGYLDMVALEKSAALVATDSGGVQKEAYFHEVPCVTLRDETEWVELVECGWNRLAPPASAESVEAALRQSLKGPTLPRPSLYGDGRAAEMIARITKDVLNAD